VCENRIKSRGEAEKLSPGICKNKALGLFESVRTGIGGGETHMDSLTFKTALVTGGSRGIGKGIAQVLAREGYDIAITYASEKEKAEEVAHYIEKECGQRCFVYQAYLQNADVPEKIVNRAIRDLGRLDVLVNNAGLSSRDEVLTLDKERLDYLINLNFKAPILAIHAAARYMVRDNIKGNIVNITSTRGIRAYPNDFIYGATKAALSRATESIALELSPYGIRVNCIAPGATAVREEKSEFYSYLGGKIPIGRMGTPEDIGYAVAWLVSDKASYITGITLRVDGGLILPGMPEEKDAERIYEGWGRLKKIDFGEEM
ncbi:MAG: hypothetical protein PWR01_1879, partial [Clostridiales bacterium]|nr:hypothetical protein [Clostridiales bacterium]